MKSLNAERIKNPNYLVVFIITMDEHSRRLEISVARLDREHVIIDILQFTWRQCWLEGKPRHPSTTESNVPELHPITLDDEVVDPKTYPLSRPAADATPVSRNSSYEETCRLGSLLLIGGIIESILNLLRRALIR